MTSLLLDTYTLIGVVSEPARLSSRARDLVADAANPLLVSSFSMYEIGVAVQKRRLTLSLPPDVWFGRAILQYGIQAVDVSWNIAATAIELPRIHADPGDRIIIATALNRDLTLLTPDRHIHKYPDVKLAW